LTVHQNVHTYTVRITSCLKCVKLICKYRTLVYHYFEFKLIYVFIGLNHFNDVNCSKKTLHIEFDLDQCLIDCDRYRIAMCHRRSELNPNLPLS